MIGKEEENDAIVKDIFKSQLGSPTANPIREIAARFNRVESDIKALRADVGMLKAKAAEQPPDATVTQEGEITKLDRIIIEFGHILDSRKKKA